MKLTQPVAVVQGAIVRRRRIIRRRLAVGALVEPVVQPTHTLLDCTLMVWVCPHRLILRNQSGTAADARRNIYD